MSISYSAPTPSILHRWRCPHRDGM
uniref:Uncharacterized protein n=1 Tax=Anguilla anguilla TaxID=7936 RepID=A0A0E9PWP9_ANGAN